MARAFGGTMKKKLTIIGACGMAAVIGAVSIVSSMTAGSDTKKNNGGTVVADKQDEVQTPAVSGNTNISSVGVSSVLDTMDSTSSDISEITGNMSYINVGFAGMMDAFNNYLYENDDITKEEVNNAIKDMDIATEIVPEGSVISGYTNLGISNVTTYLNVRKGAGTNNTIIGKMPGNAACEILETKNGWYKIKSGDVTGYVSADYILTGYEANVKAMEKMEKMLIVNCDKLNVREQPSTSCDVSTKVSKGAHLEILEEEKDGWYKISINNLTGYVSADYVTVAYTLPTAEKVTVYSGSYNTNEPVPQKVIDLINYAYQFLGNPYKWGGNSLTNGIDCSGFVKQIFKKFGYNLPRTSSQYRTGVGTTIPLSQIRPGDILVYKYSDGTGHVAIYIGNGKIIHAANARAGICIGNYNFVRPYRAVRVIK